MTEKKSNKSGTKAFALTFSKIVTLLLSMLTAMILARTLNLTEYGTYSELLTVSSIGVSIFSLGLPNALNYFLPRCADLTGKRKFIGFYFVCITVISLLLMGVMAVANRAISAYYDNPQLIRYSYFLVLIPWTKLIISSRSNLLVAEGKVTREIAYCIANGVLLALIAVMTRLDGGNFDRYIASYVIVECFFAVVVYLEAFLVSGKRIQISIHGAGLKELLIYTIPLGLSTAISTISLDLDKLIIGFLMDEASVAVYANAGKELPFSLISTSFTAIFLPQIVLLVKEKKIKAATERWKDIMQINYIILALCVVASMVFAPQIISLLYSPSYLGGVTIFRIYSLTLLLRITYWAMILNAYGRTNEIMYNSLVCLAINAVSSVILYQLLGFIGPAVATLLSIFSMVAMQVWRTSRLVEMSVWDIIPVKKFIMPTVVSIGTGLLVWALTEVLHMGTDTRGIVMAVIIGVIWVVVYLLIFGKRLIGLWKKLNQEV